MSRRAEVAPSILAADFSRLAEEIRRVEPYSGRIHADVMDGHFVPNLTMGPALVASIRPVTTKPIEVHLMVEDPSAFVEAFAEAGADRLIFHVEAAPDPAELARAITKAGPSAGIALRPATPWERAEPFLELLDLVIVMTVEPGFGGQAFLEAMLPKIEAAAGAVMKRRLDADIEVDGGIDPSSAARARAAGANVFVAGTSIFDSPDPAKAARGIAETIGAEVD